MIRDPRNLFASRIKKTEFNSDRLSYPASFNSNMQSILQVWTDHADASMRSDAGPSNILPIYFDRWLTDDRYRLRIAQQIGIQPPTGVISQRSPQGGGSSFSPESSISSTEVKSLLNRASLLNTSQRMLLEKVLSEIGEKRAQVAGFFADPE